MTSTTSIPLTGVNGTIKIPNYSDNMLECATKATRKQFPDPSCTGFVGEIDQATKTARSIAATREIFEHMTPENFIEPSKYEVDGIIDTMYVVNTKQPAEEITFNVLTPGGPTPVATYVRVDNLPSEVLAMVRVFSETKKKADTAVMDAILLDTANTLIQERVREHVTESAIGSIVDAVAQCNHDPSNVIVPQTLKVVENNGHIDIVKVGPEKEFVACRAQDFEIHTAKDGEPIIKSFDIDVILARQKEIQQAHEAKLKVEWDDREGPIFLDPKAVGEK